MTLYDIKPQFQALLRPLVKRLAAMHVSANQVTLFAMFGSIALGAFLTFNVSVEKAFLLLPIWMILRMALNAIDGMLAREFHQKSNLGAFLNELGDVVSDAALFLPFALVTPFSPFSVGLVIFLAVLSEFAGVLALTMNASRRYDGPMGKSDRALIFGALGLWMGVGGTFYGGFYWIMPAMAVLIGLTVLNRIRKALLEMGEFEEGGDNEPKSSV